MPASNTTYEYQIVPIVNGVEGIPQTVTTDIKFDGAFIMDDTYTYQIILNLQKDSLTRNNPSSIAVARLTKNGQIENVLKTSEEIARVAAVVVKAANELDITGELIKTGKTKAEYALEEAKKTLARKGITFDEDELITYIKAAVTALRADISNTSAEKH